jgi:superfamily II RNA helicase
VSTTEAALREQFEAAHPYPLDPFQRDALDILDAGRSVLVAAPTGSGKTLIAEYAIARAITRGRRAFYTTPLKALSNQKFHDLAALHGLEHVGLLTGDVSYNGGASVVVMTTEVLRNMIYANPGGLADLDCVILDEVHYLEDRYRGSVWEEIILAAPREVTLVSLSATVSNAEELAEWIAGVRGSTGAVIEEHRPVELRHLYIAGDRSTDDLLMLPTFVEGSINREGLSLFAPKARTGPHQQRRTRFYRPRRSDVVERLQRADLLPAIYFIFSRAGCDDAVRQCTDEGIRLTTSEERREIRAIADAHMEALSDQDLRVLRYRQFLNGLESGIAAHHAGLVPPFREAVEELFAAALVKVVFATETLALGINMPARTVVVEQLSKFGGDGHKDLTAGEYTQLTGRAGRRGIDPVGYAAVLWSPFHDFADVAALAASRSRPLRSSFRPTYNMVVNLVRRYPRDAAYALVRSSFAQYLSDVPLTRQLDAVREILQERGYLVGWHVSPAGERLAGLYHDKDLLVAEALGQGVLDGLDGPSLAAVLSCTTYEARRHQAPDGRLSARLVRRISEFEDLATGLRIDERRLTLPRTGALDPGFAFLAFEWARGTELRTLLQGQAPRRDRDDDNRRGRARPGESSIGPGDFVRNIKQLVDLLRQVGSVADNARTARTARSVADDLVHGVVAASSGPGRLEEVLVDAEPEVSDDPR